MFHLKAWAAATAMALLTGCGAVGGAVDIAFKLGHGLGELGMASTKHAVNAAKGGIEVAKGGLELAGGTVKLLDQSHHAGHNTRMRNLEYEQAADASPSRR